MWYYFLSRLCGTFLFGGVSCPAISRRQVAGYRSLPIGWRVQPQSLARPHILAFGGSFLTTINIECMNWTTRGGRGPHFSFPRVTPRSSSLNYLSKDSIIRSWGNADVRSASTGSISVLPNRAYTPHSQKPRCDRLQPRRMRESLLFVLRVGFDKPKQGGA